MLFKKSKKIINKLKEDKNLILIGAYKYGEEVILLEFSIDEMPQKIRLDEFFVFEEGVSLSNSQAPYLEQFLNYSGDVRISDIYGYTKEQSNPTRFTFFLYFAKTGSTISTPYGNIVIDRIDKMPKRLIDIIEYEESD